MIKNQLTENIVGFVLKPDSTSQQIKTLFENELNINGFTILDLSRKKLTKKEIKILHCVKRSWRYDPNKYYEYMMQDETIGYLVKHIPCVQIVYFLLVRNYEDYITKLTIATTIL